ncbi:MAG TPA: TA system VapC family ribonuclease toxin [Vicinamibacteria bacterium]|nr:TA system VapC family ribonuclease toxin [Vicinamibacteria bacterium]
MLSIDTNLLLFSVNQDCAEHLKARSFVEACVERSDVAIAELVLVELYVLLRNPAVLRKPLGAMEAAAICQPFRTHPRWALIDCAPVMARVWEAAARKGTARRRIFDARLAYTLLHHGVLELATHNVKDFGDFGFERIFDPLVDSDSPNPVV